ncbi:MAG TPA: hypothetical protein VNN18_10475 [Candidatus Xenobia bacterium]|nr:hypothetical protein [Candidatus Xenobia bacterium]
MALVPIKTSTGTGYCDCICGCYELASMRDDETGRGYCYRCAEEHLERNRKVLKRIPRRQPPAATPTLPPGAKPPALQHSA